MQKLTNEQIEVFIQMGESYATKPSVLERDKEVALHVAAVAVAILRKDLEAAGIIRGLSSGF